MADSTGSQGQNQQQAATQPYNAYHQPEPPMLHQPGGGAAMPLPPIPLDAQQQQAAAKQSLKQWWTKFTKQQQAAANASGASSSSKSEVSPTNAGYRAVFGVPLTESLKYAGVAISMVGPDGVNQVYGYIPIVVAKCGLFLKQKAITVEGVFRISGSTRRMKELQDIFDRPPSYGKDVVWGPWSVHDAANVLRRYLNRMPEPVVPLELYDDFRNALPPLGKVNDPDAILASVARYKALIASLPSSSKYLLCYVLDLLNVFARNHDTNLMPASNLAVVFQPGLIRGPDDLGPSSNAVPGAIPIPNAASSATNSGEVSEANSAFSPPAFPQMSRSSSNPANQLPDIGSSASSVSGNQSNVLELQRRQDDLKINQEVLEFLINHQDHFVALPEPQSSSSTEASPISPQSASGASSWSANRAQQQATPTNPAIPLAQTQPSDRSLDNPLAPPQAPFANMQISRDGSRQGSPSRSPRLNPADAPIISSRSQSVQHEKSGLAPISTARAPPGPATATFPLQQQSVQQQQQQQQQLPAPSIKERDGSRQPRKLKKARTPISSGPETPLSPAGSTAFWDPANHQPQIRSGSRPSTSSGRAAGDASAQYRQAGPSSAAMPAPIHTAITGVYDDDDVPLSAVTIRGGSASPNAGAVKRSKTLPSPGATRGASPRSVSSRRQSESRASSSPPLSPPAGNSPLVVGYGSPSPQSRGTSPVNPVSIVETAASPSLLSASQPGPLLSSLQLGRSESVQTASTRASSSGTGQSYRTPAVDDHAFIAPPAVDLDSEYSEATDDEEGRSRRKGWRKAFSRGKKGSEGSTRSSSPGRTVSASQTSNRATQQPPPAKAAPVAPIPIPAQQENRRLSVGQAAAPGDRRKSMDGSRPNTPLRESHVPLPAFGSQDTTRAAKASAETKKSSSSSDKQNVSSTGIAPVPIRPSKSVSPPHASDRIISDLLSSSPSQSMAATSTSSRKPSVSNLGKSPGSYHTTSPTSQHHTPQYGSSPHESGSHLRAVKNPRPVGQEKEGGGSISKKEAKKIADDKAKKDIDAIKDAVANIGRPA